MIPSTIDAWVAPPALPRPLADQALLVSPELALVDDELRRDAVALLPELRPYDFLEQLRETRPPLVWAPVEPYREEEPAESRHPHLAVAVAAYLATAVVRTVAFNVVVFACIALVVLIVNLAA